MSDIKLPEHKQVEPISKVTIEVTKEGTISVKLIGPHMRKRMLLQVIRALRLKYRETIILYRAQNLADRVKEEIEIKQEIEAQSKKE